MIARCPKCGAEMEGDVAIGDFVECPSCNGTFTLEKKDVATQMGVLRQMDKGAAAGAMSGSTRKRSFRVPQFAQGALATALVFTGGILLFSLCSNKGGEAGNQARANEIGNIPSTASEPPVKTASAPPTSTKNTVQTQKTEIDPGAELYKEAMRYYNGDDVLQDYTRAVELLIKASEKGSAEADGQLAFIYWYGEAGQSVDDAKAISYAKKSGKNKTQLAHQILGDSYLHGVEKAQKQDFKAAYSEFAMASNYYYSRFLVGLMRYHGVGTKEDKRGAAEQFYLNCKDKPNNNDYAGFSALCLGYMYAHGEGVGRNEAESNSLLRWGFKASGRAKLVADDNWDGDEKALIRRYARASTGELDGSTMTQELRLQYLDSLAARKWKDVWPGEMDLVKKAIYEYFLLLELTN